jgi:CRISPR-associated endoribonuclease Cas6
MDSLSEREGSSYSRSPAFSANIELKMREIMFDSPFRFIVSSPMKEFIEEIAEELIRRENGRICSQKVSLNSVEVSDLTISRDRIKIKMLSPMTIYSTLSKADGKKKTYYYNPFEREFSELVSENAKKKFRAFYGKEIDGEIRLTRLDETIKELESAIKEILEIVSREMPPKAVKIGYCTNCGYREFCWS